MPLDIVKQSATVETIFSGINYLEKLKDVAPSGLLNEMRGRGGNETITAMPDSIFNKFSVFNYSKLVKGAVYQPQGHFIGYDSETNVDPNLTDRLNQEQINRAYNRAILASGQQASLDEKSKTYEQQHAELGKIITNSINQAAQIKKESQLFATRKTNLANPTASNIINWSKTSIDSLVGFQPYSMTDFMFCKNYGKIPNNRLITIRRYPFPIDDMIRIPGKNQKNPIPIAQAVTWFGGDTENKLDSIANLKWNLKWFTLTATEQEIDGNEVLVTDVAQFLKKIPKAEKIADQLVKIYIGINGTDENLQQLSGMEKKLQEYQRGLYNDKGPYWNRVYGPVNVIHQTTRRERGMQDGWDTAFTLNFHYSFRSFNGLSPKVVALDLIASFLNLTYNDAEFRGQFGRYFPKPGVKFDPTTGQVIADLLTKWATSFEAGTMGDIMKLVNQITSGVQGAVQNGIAAVKKDGVKPIIDKAKRIGQVEAITALANAIPNLISVKSALSDRPVGEWHMTVGNPMNPIMVMGDLLCTGCTLKFDEEMGPDDFPAGCTFSVSFRQGKPRDKVAIERMFNLGQGKLLHSPLRDPSSASDTFGQTNNTEWDALRKELDTQTVIDVSKELPLSSFNKYRNRVRKAYGYDVPNETPAFGDKDSILWLYYDRGQHKT